MEPKIIKTAEGLNLIGGRQIIKLQSEDTNRTITVMTSKVPAGGGVPLHVHQREDEIFQIIEGDLEVTVGGKISLLTTGDMIFMPRKIAHGFKAVTDTTMWTTLTPAGIETMFIELAALPAGPPDIQKMTEICSKYEITFPASNTSKT